MGINEQRIFEALLERMKTCKMDADESVAFVKAARDAKQELERADGSTPDAEGIAKTISDMVDGALKGGRGVTKRDLIAAGLLSVQAAQDKAMSSAQLGIILGPEGRVGFGLTDKKQMFNEAGSPMIFRFWLPDGAEYKIFMDGGHTFPPGAIHHNLLGLRLGMAEVLLRKAAKGERITDADIDSIFK